MKLTKDAILKKMENLAGNADVSVARSLLTSPITTEFDPLIAGKLLSDYIISPKEILPTWNARFENALRTGFKLAGCGDFVRKMKSLPEGTELINLAFKNDGMSGHFWFDRRNEELIGFVIAEREKVHKD